MVNNMSSIMSITDQDLVKEEPILLMSPRNPVPTETIFLSNIDQAVTFPVETVFFYEVPPNMASAASTVGIAGKVKKAVEEVLLVPYYFMAGRLNFSDETKRLELVCNNAGALFVSAKSRFCLKDLGNLSHPNPSFHHFVLRPGIYKSLAETALFTIQVTRFECGGFALGFTTNHAILDGKSASEMFHNLASICRGEGLKTNHINNDRTCMKARTPPQILFPHTEYVKLARTSSLLSSFTSQKRPSPSPHIFSDKYTHKLFSFTPQMLKLLKQKAMIECSTFEAILAHIWRARTRAILGHDCDQHQDQDSTVLFAVDIRDTISPPLPSSFIGNAVITGYARTKARDLVGGPLSYGVEMVREGRERVTSEYIRSVIDWLEVYKGTPATCGCAFYVSAWWKLGFGEVDLGFGRAKHAGPIVSGNDEFVLLLDGGDCDEGGKGLGINVWIGLEKDKMERFLKCVFEM
ncbi:omega-hydroxypalmitate O-feruloyl transferase-like [Sesamum indicum]|uniref:Omega-hydroxypalmitate O-feruloyl transferase-like n=1 Tax=Sesamum indicum TaxID=4182 RepID=A0A6I9SNK9_SESIN|nr:omega-hydroxypalmitate O-feruloyl transferase-like [Sesamum indicum]